MTEDQPQRGRKGRIVVVTAILLFFVAACGFSRDGLKTSAAGSSTADTRSLSDGVVPDSALTDSGFSADTVDPSTDSTEFTDYTDYTDSSTDSSDTGAAVDAAPLIPLLIDPPSLPATPPAPGPPHRTAADPNGNQEIVYGTYTYDNLDDFLFGDWNCLECDTSAPSFAGAVDKVAREPDGRFLSVSMARFTDPAQAADALKQVVDDRTTNDSQIWDKQIPSVPDIPGASASISKQNPTGQDYEVHFVVKGDLFIIDFGTGSATPVDLNAANAFAKLQYQKALAG